MRTKKPVLVEDGRLMAKEPEKFPELPKYKLYFIAGDSHVCGKADKPIRFEPNKPDERDPLPHAYVHQSLGDYLIQYDREIDGYGRIVGEARYKWSPEAKDAFEALDKAE